MELSLKHDRGVAGTTILLSLIVSLFIIGLLVAIFSLMGGELQTSTYTATSVTTGNETLTTVAETGEDFSVSGYRDVVCTVSDVTNATSGTLISSGNYTVTNCNIAFAVGDVGFNNTNWNVSYSFTYNDDNTATDVMNDTVTGLSGSVDWFDIFIVIGAMVVLILLTVIIISTIRGSGLMGSGGYRSNGNVGSA